jgi:hypothetical protein
MRRLIFALFMLATAAAYAADAPPAIKPGWTVLPEPELRQVVVTEDDSTRIEELRVRGQTVKVTVQPKNAPAYEIIVGDASHELSPGAGSTRGAIGKSVWRLVDF